MQITEMTVPGPAAGLRPGLPNRVGSAEVPVRRYEPAAQAGTLQMSAAQPSTEQAGTAQSSTAQVGAARHDTAQSCTAQSGVASAGAAHEHTPQTPDAQTRAPHDSPSPPWATLVWAHGGSFVRGTLDWPEADWAARRFAEAGLRVYSVDYALASDTVKAPAPAGDVAAVLRWVAAEHPGPLVVGGASAGAHLAVLAALAQAEGDPAWSHAQDPPAPSPAGTQSQHPGAPAPDPRAMRAADALILQYPTLHRVQRHDPALAAATADLPAQRRFDAERIAEMYAFYLGADAATDQEAEVEVSEEAAKAEADEAVGVAPGGQVKFEVRVDAKHAEGRAEAARGAAGADVARSAASADPALLAPHPAHAPLIAGELAQDRLALLPPTVIVNAEFDDLRASGEQFAEQLREAGVRVWERVQPGTVHGYLNRPEESDRARTDARASIGFFVGGLRAILR